MTRPKILLIGAGGHCHACIDVIEQEGRFEIIGVIDNKEGAPLNSVFGYTIVGSDDDLPSLAEEYEYACVSFGQIASATARIRIVKHLKELGFQLPTIISPSAYVSRHAWIGEGTVVMHGAVVNAGAKVGANCILNSQSLVEHDVVVGNHVHLSTAAVINGGTVVGEQSFIGSGAVLIHGIEVAAHSFVRAGSLVKSQSDCKQMNED